MLLENFHRLIPPETKNKTTGHGYDQPHSYILKPCEFADYLSHLPITAQVTEPHPGICRGRSAVGRQYMHNRLDLVDMAFADAVQMDFGGSINAVVH